MTSQYKPINFWKVNVLFKRTNAKEIFSLSFLVICFVQVWVNLKVQTVFFVSTLYGMLRSARHP